MRKEQLKKGRKDQKGRDVYDIAFMRKIARDYREGDKSLRQLSLLYGVSPVSVSRWALKFSSELAEDQIISPMTEQELKDMELLQKQVEALKKKLEYEQMRTFALETMIDLAKTELGIDVRKNFGAKQPKK